MKMLKNICFALVVQFVIYLVQFVLIPFIYMPHPSDQGTSTFIVCATTAVVGSYGFYFFVHKIRYWVFSLPFYPMLVKIYHPTDIYGIGYDGFLFSFNENWGIAIWTIVVLITQLIVYLMVRIVKKKIKNKRT